MSRRAALLVTGLIVALSLGALMRPVHAQPSAQPMTLLSAASTLNAAVGVDSTFLTRCARIAVYVDWSTGVSAGAINFETATTSGYTGTWASAATADTYASGSPKQDVVQITGGLLTLRTRIATGVVGGTVTTTIACN